MIEFSDGKVYQVSPLFARDLVYYSSRERQPGCFFNNVLRRRPGYSALRLSAWPDEVSGAGVLVDLRIPVSAGHVKG